MFIFNIIYLREGIHRALIGVKTFPLHVNIFLSSRTWIEIFKVHTFIFEATMKMHLAYWAGTWGLIVSKQYLPNGFSGPPPAASSSTANTGQKLDSKHVGCWSEVISAPGPSTGGGGGLAVAAAVAVGTAAVAAAVGPGSCWRTARRPGWGRWWWACRGCGSPGAGG